VTKIDYLSADQEENFVIAQANAPLDENNKFVRPYVMSRLLGESEEHPAEEVQYMDVSPQSDCFCICCTYPFFGT